MFQVVLVNINAISASAANRLNIVFVISKVATILTVILAGLVRIGQGWRSIRLAGNERTPRSRTHAVFT